MDILHEEHEPGQHDHEDLGEGEAPVTDVPAEPSAPPREELASAPDPEAMPFRHETCAECGEAIADEHDATVYPYAGVSYHAACAPAAPPPAPTAEG